MRTMGRCNARKKHSVGVLGCCCGAEPQATRFARTCRDPSGYWYSRHANGRFEPQRCGFDVARGLPRCAAPPLGTRAREHIGRAADAALNRRPPRPKTDKGRVQLRERATQLLCRSPDRRTHREAGCGLRRARTVPLEIVAVGSLAVRGALADPG